MPKCPLCKQSMDEILQPLGWWIDVNSGTVYSGNDYGYLTSQQGRILMAMREASPRYMSSKELLEASGSKAMNSKLVEVQIFHIRERLKHTSVVVETLHGRGYRIPPAV